MRPRSPLHDAGFLNISRQSAIRRQHTGNRSPRRGNRPYATRQRRRSAPAHHPRNPPQQSSISLFAAERFFFCKGVAKADPKAVFRLSARTDCFIKCVSSFKPLFVFDSGFRTACPASVRRPWMLAGPPRHYSAGSTIIPVRHSSPPSGQKIGDTSAHIPGAHKKTVSPPQKREKSHRRDIYVRQVNNYTVPSIVYTIKVQRPRPSSSSNIIAIPTTATNCCLRESIFFSRAQGDRR